jgi:trimeric autotransporter adhesin
MARPARTNRAQARRQHRTRAAIAIVAAVVVIGGGGAAWAMTRSSGPAYRLATVERATVAQTVDTVGTVSTVNQASLAFPVSGTVSSVKVRVGDTVTAGQTVASLQTTALQQDVASQDAAVASARQTLASDEAVQDGTATTTTTATNQAAITGSTRVTLLAAVADAKPSTAPSGKSSAAPGGPTGSKPTGGGTGATSITAAQNAVTQAQNALDQAIATQNGNVSAAARACSAAPSEKTVSSDGSGNLTGPVGGTSADNADVVTLEKADGSVVTTTTSANPQAVAGGGSYTFAGLTASTSYQVEIDPGVSADCATAVTAVEHQQKLLVDTAESTLKTALRTLTQAITALEKQAASGAKSGSGSATGTGSGTHSGGTGTSGGTGGTGGTGSSGGTGGGATRTVTAEQIAADQKAIDAAKAELVLSQQNLDQATLTAPIAGKVAQVALASGQSVTGGSTSDTIKILGAGQKQVTTTIGINDVDLVKKGEAVAVTVDGVSTPLTGTVSLIGIMNTSGTSGSTTTYPVTVVLAPTDLPLYDGAGASLAISVGSAANVLTVPGSAVHALGPLDTVSVYSGGKVSTARVTLGVQGSDLVQVVSGLTAGQRVVLADVSEKVPSSTTTGRGFGGGGLGGTGLGGTGLGGTGLGGTTRIGGR